MSWHKAKCSIKTAPNWPLFTFHVRTTEEQQSKLQLLIPSHIHQLNMNSSSIPTPKTPIQNNNDECVQISVGSDLTEPSLDRKPSAEGTGISYDFDSYSIKDVVFNENEDAILAIGDDNIITNTKLDRFMINNYIRKLECKRSIIILSSSTLGSSRIG